MVCASEEACRLRIVDLVRDDVPDLGQAEESLLSRYRRGDVNHPLGVFSPSQPWVPLGEGRYWVGVHTWRAGIRTAWLVFFREASDGDDEATGWDREEWEEDFAGLASYEAVTSAMGRI